MSGSIEKLNWKYVTASQMRKNNYITHVCLGSYYGMLFSIYRDIYEQEKIKSDGMLVAFGDSQ